MCNVSKEKMYVKKMIIIKRERKRGAQWVSCVTVYLYFFGRHHTTFAAKYGLINRIKSTTKHRF